MTRASAGATFPIASFDQMYPDKFQTHLTSEVSKARKQLSQVSERESPMNRSLLDGAVSFSGSYRKCVK